MALYRAQHHATSAHCDPSSITSCTRNREQVSVSNECAICLDGMEKHLAALSCGHVFHHLCVNKALAFRRNCPVCRRNTSPQHIIPLFANFGAVNSCDKAFHTSRPASNLPEQLKEIRKELNHVYKIQQMTSNQSFRRQQAFTLRGQQLEQVTRRMQHIQYELDKTKVDLKRCQRIESRTYAQLNEAKQAKDALEQKIRHAADRMLERIRERQHHRCPSCENQWRVVKSVALEISTANGTSCCIRHSRPASRNKSRAPMRTLRQSQHDLGDYDF